MIEKQDRIERDASEHAAHFLETITADLDITNLLTLVRDNPADALSKIQSTHQIVLEKRRIAQALLTSLRVHPTERQEHNVTKPTGKNVGQHSTLLQ